MATVKNTKTSIKPKVIFKPINGVECEFCDAGAVGYASCKKGPFTNKLPYCPDHKKIAKEKIVEL